MALLARHAPGDLVAFGGAGDRHAEALVADALNLAETLGDPQPGRDVLVVAGDRYRFAVAAIAAWVRGHAIALPPNAQDAVVRGMATAPSIGSLLHDTDADIGIDIREFENSPRGSRGTTSGGASLPEIPMDRRFAVVHTSGSSGAATAHPKTAGQLLGEALMLVDHFGVGAGARVAATVPSHHIYGLLFSVLVPLCGGGAFSRETPLHAEAVVGLMREQKARVLVSVPAHLRAFRLLDELPPHDRIFSSGAPLMRELARFFCERFGSAVTEVLGSTETGGMASRAGVEDDRWRPLPGVRVSAESGGRLVIESPFLAPDTRQPFVTEDRIALDEDGSFEHLGRADDIVKVAGKRVALGDVERRLLAIPGVEDVGVASVEVGGPRGNELLAIVVAPGWSPDALRTRLRKYFDPVVVPRRVRVLDTIVRDERGKLSRASILAQYDATPAVVTDFDVGSVDATDREARGGTEEVRRVELRPPKSLYWFRGHFVDYPLVPGVVELDLVVERAKAHWPDLRSLSRVLKLKFKRPIRPGEKLVLELRRNPQRPRVNFEFMAEGGVASSGVLDFGPRADA